MARMLNSESAYDDDKDVLSIYLKEINRIPMISHEEENELALKAKAGDKRAREKLINSNLRFVVTVAKKYQGQGLPLEDLINEGNLGLLTALEKFEPEKGYHFISYAVWWIRQSILKAVCEKSRAVRLPLNRANELFQIQKIQKTLIHESGSSDVSVDDIAAESGLEPDLIRDLLAVSREMVSFDAPVASKGEISDSKVGDFIEDDKMGPEEEVMQASLKEDVETLLSTLTEKERDIIILRFGLHDTKPMSLKEIGDLYGLTKERIRQIEKRAIEKMKMPARYRLIESYKIA
ncbi:MAG: RNA polymerase sigma factor RpoD/SigA [Bullifex sp.]|nr:RNA polymerase sigma factor RpoD/SigA [Spirochaetales bacterium]MDY2816405.1 RNA polymerase sigma factor RpoD/SigA [Bullifex sp.]MDD7537006.1 RNA polymerase sigma factor RpoD/SigA [Spirochaetales bacterium]MDY4799608.1 RNA polymerase sigma factor RpoD/SigA [Bullifex sp.]MDY5057509.1 RNA polymerase sigma factor RpoD/SigA [Bullifex sp.]